MFHSSFVGSATGFPDPLWVQSKIYSNATKNNFCTFQQTTSFFLEEAQVLKYILSF